MMVTYPGCIHENGGQAPPPSKQPNCPARAGACCCHSAAILASGGRYHRPAQPSPAQPSPWQNFAGIPFPVLRLHQLEIRVRNTQLCHAPNPQHPAGVCQLGPSPVSSLFAWILMEMCRVAADLITAARWIISVSNSPLNISITSAGLGWAGLDH